MAPSDLCCTIGTNVDTKVVLVTSLAECSKRYRDKKKTIIIIGTVLDVEICPKVTTLGRRRNVLIEKIDLGGGNMKVTTINIRSVKIHTPGPLRTDTDGDGVRGLLLPP